MSPPGLHDLDERLRRLEIEVAKQRVHLESLVHLDEKVNDLVSGLRLQAEIAEQRARQRERLLRAAVAIITAVNGVIALLSYGGLG